MPAAATTLPDNFRDEDHVEDFMTEPSDLLRVDLAKVPGDIIVLGVGGKMGPTLARLAKRALPNQRVIGVARFSEAGLREKLQSWDIECIEADLLDRAQIEKLPKSPNVVFMAGRKFGSTGAEHLTWAMNAHVPAMVAEVFAKSRIVTFSTGCVYPYVNVTRWRRDRRHARDAAVRHLREFLRRARSACSNISRASTKRRAASSGSITRSTCATASCTTSRRKSRPNRSIDLDRRPCERDLAGRCQYA